MDKTDIDKRISDHSTGKDSPASTKKKGKEARKWDNAGTIQEGKSLDYSSSNANQPNGNDDGDEDLENLVRTLRERYLYRYPIT